jgi:putative DNA primase/helicase
MPARLNACIGGRVLAWTEYQPGSHRVRCPFCGRSDRDKTLGLTIWNDASGVAHCFRCDFKESYRPKRGAIAFNGAQSRIRRVQTQTHEQLSDYGHSLWNETRPLYGVAVEYLKARRCVIPPSDSDLRFHPSLKHPGGYIGPALVGLVSDAVTGLPLSLHRTWIQNDGRKADVETPRMLLGRHRKQGGVIRLWPDDAVTYGLGIAEGIETALSLAWGYSPVWSCIDAGNLAAFRCIPGLESIVIGADNDQAGIAAAQSCAARLADAGVEVLITRQSENDLNDALREKI